MEGLLRRTVTEDIEIEWIRAGGLWPAEVDPGQLESAVLNLAINARDAMPEGGRLTIETANSRLDDDYAAAFQRWFPTTVEADDSGSPVQSQLNDKRKHVSKISSGNATTVFSRFSKESVDWIEQTYAKDIALYKKHCPEGYRKYTRTE